MIKFPPDAQAESMANGSNVCLRCLDFFLGTAFSSLAFRTQNTSPIQRQKFPEQLSISVVKVQTASRSSSLRVRVISDLS
jgi:hypothetical protein